MTDFTKITNAPSPGTGSPVGKNATYDIYAIIFLFLSVNWSIVSIDTLGIDGAAVTPFAAGIIIFVLSINILPKLNGAVKIWSVWIAYAILNALVCGINRSTFPRFLDLLIQLLVPLWALTASYTLTLRGRLNMISMLFWILLSCCVEMSLRSHAFSNFNLMSRLASLNGVNANTLGIYLALFLPFCVIHYLPKRRRFPMLILILLIITMIFRTASRTALTLAAVALAGCFILWRNKVLGYLLTACVFLIILTHSDFFEDTAMWQRMQNTELDMEKMYFGDTWLAKALGDRSSYYFGGWEIFKEFPVHGVGLNNYIFHNPFSGHVCHVEVMAQLSEEGIIGAGIFICFYVFIAWQLWKTRKFSAMLEWRFCLLMFVMVCIINFASYTSMRCIYYILFGYILGYLDNLAGSGENTNPAAPCQSANNI